MNPHEILSRYPGCEIAVAWTELFLDDHSTGEVTAFDLARRRAPDMSPEALLAIVKETMRGETIGRAEEALAQVDHPNFRLYLAAKMGML